MARLGDEGQSRLLEVRRAVLLRQRQRVRNRLHLHRLRQPHLALHAQTLHAVLVRRGQQVLRLRNALLGQRRGQALRVQIVQQRAEDGRRVRQRTS